MNKKIERRMYMQRYMEVRSANLRTAGLCIKCGKKRSKTRKDFQMCKNCAAECAAKSREARKRAKK